MTSIEGIKVKDKSESLEKWIISIQREWKNNKRNNKNRRAYEIEMHVSLYDDSIQDIIYIISSNFD